MHNQMGRAVKAQPLRKKGESRESTGTHKEEDGKHNPKERRRGKQHHPQGEKESSTTPEEGESSTIPKGREGAGHSNLKKNRLKLEKPLNSK